MLKKTFTYTDYNGVVRTEDHYFNLTKAEAMELELGYEGGYAEMIRKIVAANNVPELIKIFKEIVFKAYGVKSEDGRRFMKSEEISKAFAETPAFSDLFIELATNSDSAAKFVNGILPADMQRPDAELKAEAAKLIDVPVSNA